MSSHIRTQIRQLMKARILNQTDAQARVDINRTVPYESGSPPAICISLGNETIERDTMDRSQRRVVEVYFDVMASNKQGEPAAQTLDKILAQLEARLLEGAWSKALIFDMAPRGVEQIFDGDGEQKAGQLRLVMQVEYHTREGIPTVVI